MFARSIVLTATMMLGGVSLHAEQAAKSVEVLAPWKGEGYVYRSAQDEIKFMGVYRGILFVKSEGQKELDALPIVCPSTQTADLNTNKVTTQGDCQIGVENDIIFARIECVGMDGTCQGTFKLKGGTGKFKDISGGSTMIARADNRAFAAIEGAGVAVKASTGLFVLQDLTYKIPSK